MDPELVVALDISDIKKAMELAKSITCETITLEVGTPLVKAGGVAAVRSIVEEANGRPVHVDLKTIDFPEKELTPHLEIGISSVSMLAIATDEDIMRGLDFASSYDAMLWVSTLGYPPSLLDNRVAEISDLGVSSMIAHGMGEPNQAFEDMIEKAKLIRTSGKNISLCVGGGITMGNIDRLRSIGPSNIIIGRSIISSSNPNDEVDSILNKWRKII